MTEDRLLLALALPLDGFLGELLAENPKLSGKELAAAAQAAGKACTPGQAKKIREAYKARGAGDAPEAEADGTPPSLDDVWARARECFLAGDARGGESWVRTWARMKALVPDGAKDADPMRWDILTPAERACLLALTAKAGGQALDEDALWFLGLLARVPEARTEVHPAHVPLDPPRPAGVVVP